MNFKKLLIHLTVAAVIVLALVFGSWLLLQMLEEGDSEAMRQEMRKSTARRGLFDKK